MAAAIEFVRSSGWADGTLGAMGVKAIATYLNERRFFTRDGGRWGLAQIHAILTRTTYIG